MLKKMFSLEIKGITAGAFIIALFSLIAKALGLLRDRILAGQFGAGDWLDAYYAAFRIPDMVYNLLILGAVSAGFIPVFSKLYSKFDRGKRAWLMVSGLINTGGLALIAISLLLIVFANYFVAWITPGFAEEKLKITVNLSRIMFLSPLLLGLSSIFSGILQNFKRFFIFSLAPIMYNFGIIIGVLYFVPYLGIYGLAWGVVFGAFLHMLIQLPIILKLGFKYSLKLSFTKDLKKIYGLMGPRSLSLIVNQANYFIVTIIASGLAAGSLTVFNFANNLQSLPISLFGVSFAVASFPILSSAANNRLMHKYINNLTYVIKQILFFAIPFMVIFIVLRAQMVRIIFGSGLFSWDDTNHTLQTLGFFSISIFAQSLIPLFCRAFYALHNTITPFICGFIAMFFNVFFSLLFIKILPKYGFSSVSGLALAFSLSQIIYLIMLWISLKIKIKHLKEISILLTILKVSIASMVMGLYIWSAKYYIEPMVGTDTFVGVFLQTVFSLSIGLIVFIIVLIILKTEEFKILISSITKKIFKEAKPINDIISQ